MNKRTVKQMMIKKDLIFWSVFADKALAPCTFLGRSSSVSVLPTDCFVLLPGAEDGSRRADRYSLTHRHASAHADRATHCDTHTHTRTRQHPPKLKALKLRGKTIVRDVILVSGLQIFMREKSQKMLI